MLPLATYCHTSTPSTSSSNIWLVSNIQPVAVRRSKCKAYTRSMGWSNGNVKYLLTNYSTTFWSQIDPVATIVELTSGFLVLLGWFMRKWKRISSSNTACFDWVNHHYQGELFIWGPLRIPNPHLTNHLACKLIQRNNTGSWKEDSEWVWLMTHQLDIGKITFYRLSGKTTIPCNGSINRKLSNWLPNCNQEIAAVIVYM